jgi:Ca2+-transporting ATPase
MTARGTGLTLDQVRDRLAEEGPNALPGKVRRSLLALAADILEEPMLLLLLGAGAVYMVLGDIHDALMLLAFAGLSIVIELVQAGRTDRAIAALGELGAAQATVIREGEHRKIPSTEVVRGDLLVLSEGDRIAADGWLVTAESLQADEALLTGESVPVMKRALEPGETVAAPPLPGGDGLAYAFSGTLVVRGNAVMEVAATGARSRIGGIGASLADLETDAPRLTVQTRRMVRWFAAIGLGVSVLAGLLYGILRGDWLEALLAGIALAMSMLPEELPVVLTLFLTMGALRMSWVRVLARRGSAIESLGAATVLCTDKTGTLTQNRMEIAQLRLPDGRTHAIGKEASLIIPEPFVELAGLGILACLEQPFDPMETAFHELGSKHEGDSLNWRQDRGWTLHRQYALSPELLAVSHVWGGEGEDHVIAAKGAPEAIAELCDMAGDERKRLGEIVDAMAERGLRVLGVAEARWRGEAFPESQSHFDFAYRGLVGLYVPIRETVPSAVGELRSAGVRVVMITGDYPATARAIARQAGIEGGEVMTGTELDAIDYTDLAARIRDVSVFARVMPEQKLRIVQALKTAGEIVAMTGDGVNDAPSLKAAHIGIAMGKRGTDVAREASAIVLLDDDFTAIPAAMRLGRRIYDNLRKAVGFIFAVHVPIGGLALAPLLTGWPLILGPVHIALLELVIDPICALAYEAEPEERDVMRRPPRDPQGALFPRRLLIWSVIQGVVAIIVLVSLAAWVQGSEPEQARSTVFAALVASVLVLVVVNRTFGATGGLRGIRRNLSLALLLALILVFFALLFGVPAFSGLFRFAPLDGEGLLAAGLAAGILGVTLSLAKLRFRSALTR